MARIVENIKDSASQQVAHTEHIPFEGLKASHSSGKLHPASRRPPIAMIVMILVALGALGTAIFSYTQLQDAKKDVSAEKSANPTTASIVNKVKLLIDVPQDETPSIATVEDAAKLKDQPFFTNAQNDDTILLYAKAKKAIIYRESTNKIINVGPIDLSATEDAGTSETSSE